ncbi:MAG TPA: hypothetical protein VLN59_13035 [Burkholderiales bacterium]|nr:hypothetical protein [Burkholderiales bacterium]
MSEGASGSSAVSSRAGESTNVTPVSIERARNAGKCARCTFPISRDELCATLRRGGRAHLACAGITEPFGSDYARLRLAMPVAEMQARIQLAASVVRAWLKRREAVRRTPRVQDYEKMAEAAGGSSDVPSIDALTAWIASVECAFRAIGRNDALLVIARFRRSPKSWGEIASALQCSVFEAAHRLELAVIHFTDELQARGLTDSISHERAAA